MRRALKAKATQRQSVIVSKSYPAPVGGWNSRDALAEMKPEYATRLQNWFPTPVDCVLRGGYAAHAHTLTGYVKTLVTYISLTGAESMFAATDSDIYLVSTAAAGTDQALTVTNGAFQCTNMGNGTNNYLMMFNGADTPKYYNGSAWTEVTAISTPAITGITTTSIVAPCVYQGRLFLLENNQLNFWYGSAGAVSGTFTEFPLDQFAPRGGYVMWAAVWTFDGGSGMDDHIVFMTSEGEAIIYKGTNPGSAATWVRVGTFFIGKPLGRKSFVSMGGELIALTQDGIIPMSSGLANAQINERIALTDIINNEFTDAAQDYGANYGWQFTLLPLKNALIVNIPVSTTTGQKQFVMNTITKAWCEFSAWDAVCFCVFNDELYFGADTVVRKAWTGVSDLGNDIIANGKTAFNYFGSQNQKKVNMFRPVLRVNGDLNFLSGFDVDFNDTSISGTSTYTATSSATWDTSLWDTAIWETGLEVVRKWTSPSDNIGYCVAGKLKVNTHNLTIRWQSCDYIFETGGIL